MDCISPGLLIVSWFHTSCSKWGRTDFFKKLYLFQGAPLSWWTICNSPSTEAVVDSVQTCEIQALSIINLPTCINSDFFLDKPTTYRVVTDN